ncbi:peptidoglycan-binding protein [Kitasatospora sp. NRRL B-11411]|uniref:peptidoglycan-binding protein n=1 Tax=Kitasatospora sp. NRRL B-11411 TaxID=1463822 RepID=UPI000AD1900B|nr:peptidoglycan-binding protein [Kitasatospora sp. NRRL B-11411]
MLVKSPAQAAAAAKPPAADVLTAQVERQVLTSTVVVRGRVTAGQSVDVVPAVSAGAAGAAVVTKLPLKAGDEVTAGTPLLEVSGRPVFPLQGGIPVYRDLKPGSTGEDVAQLQSSLRALGFGTAHDPTGTFGEGTKAAVTALYRAHGYDPVPSSPDGSDRVAAAEEAVTAGQRALDDAREELAAQTAKVPGTGAPPPADTGSAARKRVTRATEDLAKLRTRLAAAKAASGPMVPAGEIVYLTALPARVSTVSGRVGATVNGKVLSVSAGELVISGQLVSTERDLVHPGQRVEVLSETSGFRTTGTVSTLGDSPQPSDTTAAVAGRNAPVPAGPAGYPLTVRPDAVLAPQLEGQDVRLTITAASSAGPVLVVPVTAVSADASGRTVVTVHEEGQRHRVEVATGMTGNGLVEVRPVADAVLKEGDRVVVGVKDARPAPPEGAK